jgi:hypothetical protein
MHGFNNGFKHGISHQTTPAPSKGRQYQGWIRKLRRGAGAPVTFDRLLRMLRELGYHGPITTYDDADPRRPAEPTGVTRRRPGERLATLPPSTKAKARS